MSAASTVQHEQQGQIRADETGNELP